MTTRNVCGACNTGWMATLEKRAAPVLLPLIRGQGSALDMESQFLIATWATKTAMTCETTLSKHEDNFTLQEGGVIRTQDRPPASVEVVVAAVEGWILPMHYSAIKLRMLSPGTLDDLGVVHVHTVQVGALVMQVARRDPPSPGFGALTAETVPSEIALGQDVARRIFPPQDSVRWPPVRVLKWDELLAVSRRGVALPAGWEFPDEVIQPGGDSHTRTNNW